MCYFAILLWYYLPFLLILTSIDKRNGLGYTFQKVMCNTEKEGENRYGDTLFYKRNLAGKSISLS